MAKFDGKQVAMAGGIAAVGSIVPALAASSEVGIASNVSAQAFRAVAGVSEGSVATEAEPRVSSQNCVPIAPAYALVASLRLVTYFL